MFFLFQLTSSILYDFILVIIFTAALAVLIGSLAARGTEEAYPQVAEG